MSVQKCETNVLGHFYFNYTHILIDEIALEGLEGIGLSSLWKRMEHRISAPLTEKMKARFWETILHLNDITMYQLPEAIPCVEIYDRFAIVDEETGDLKDPDVYLDGPYEYCPINNEYGSSKYYHTRKLIPSGLLHQVSYHEIMIGYGDTLVLVASIEQRWHALAGHLPIILLQQLTTIQYCLLEIIGKSRENGQMSTGKTNLFYIMKEPKSLFYLRRTLTNLDLVKVICVTQALATRGIKSLLVRLNRFHQPIILSIPKIGKTHRMVEYLKMQPGYLETTDALMRNGLITQQQVKKLKKRNNVFDFVEKDIDSPPNKIPKQTPSRTLTRKRRCIIISSKSDESSQSEDEVPEEPVKYQYKLGVGLMRQAYERILEAGLRGLSQCELGEMLGVEFYTSRVMCRIFKAKNIIREYFEDRGKQRVARFVAVAAGLDDTKYGEEKRKFLEYINQNNTTIDEQPPSTSEAVMTMEKMSDEINKIMEMGKRNITEVVPSCEENIDLKTLLESRKSLTLRQLKFGNGIIKIVKEKQCVTGFQTLSNLVAKEINQPPMVTKGLKIFLRKLVAAGQVKIYNLKWPGLGNDYNIMNLICAPHIKVTDHIVQTKYKEVYVRAMAKNPRPKKETGITCKPLSMIINPRYMKIQKLHETVIKMAYFEKIERSRSPLPEGFLSVMDLMPEITVKFAISNMSNTGLSEISHLPIEDSHFNLKLKDAPPEIAHGIMKCKSLRNALRLNLKSLGMYGLIQLIYQPDVQTVDYFNSSLVSFLFYVNRNAKVINTSGKWPREVSDIASLERYYRFDTFDDVKTYWRDVYDISVATKIVITGRCSKRTLNPPVRTEKCVEENDNGDRFGDGWGPCGFDSCFYLEVARLWRTFYVREAIPKPKIQIKKPKLAKTKTPKPGKKKVTKIKPVIKIKNVKKGRKRIPESTVSWTPEDDKFLIMCQVAITIASPSSQPGCLRVRNLVAKDILSIHDPKKTQSTCHRRTLMLQHNVYLMHEKDSLLNEMRRRRSLIQKYEGLIKKLRLRYATNMKKFINEARVPMIELIWLIWQVSISESYNRKLPCVAMDVTSFCDNFNIVPATVNKVFNLYKSPDFAVLRESVFLTVMLTFNRDVKSDVAKKMYSIFKTFPENSLRVVVDQLRRCGAISAKEKLLNNQMHRLHLDDITQSAYKISANYQRRWINRINSEFADSLYQLMKADLPRSNVKGSAEINCIFCELHASNVLDIYTSVNPEIVDAAGMSSSLDEPINAVEVESKHKLKSGSIAWDKTPNVPWDTDAVSSLYPIPEYEPILQDMARNAVVTTEIEQKYDYPIIYFLNEKGVSGCSFKELEKFTKSYGIDLAKQLSILESANILKRVGFSDNVVILLKYIHNWAMKYEDKYIMVTPWLTLDCNIRYDIFLEWASVIVNKVFESPGCSISLLSEAFELITCRAIQDVCMFLQQCDIITLQIVKCQESSLLSDDDVIPETEEFHPYESVDNMLAFPVKNTITKFVNLKKIMLENYSKV